MGSDPGRADAALTSLRELVRHVGHDLNNHLASIIVNLSLATTPGAADPDRHAQTLEALDAARHAAQLARQLFAVNRETVDEADAAVAVRQTTVATPAQPAPHIAVERRAAAPPALDTISSMARDDGRPPDGSDAGAGASDDLGPLAPGLSSPRHGTLLVLEDDESVATMMHDVLSHFGYDVAVTQSPEVCVTLFQQARATSHPFDLVVLDLTIRGGTRRGIDTLAALRDIDPDVRAVAHSGDPEADIMKHPRRFGFAGAIRKPTPLAQLSRIMQRLIAGEED